MKYLRNLKRNNPVLFILIPLIFLNLSCSLKENEIKTNEIKTNEIAIADIDIQLQKDPNLLMGKLDNGLTYYMYKNSNPKDRVTMHLVVHAGSFHENENERGIAHFLEHMLFEGSENFKSGEMVKYFQKIGMDFGEDANAHTGFYETVYDINLPFGNQSYLEDAFLIYRDFMAGALLETKEIEQEKKVILAEKKARDSSEYRTYIEIFSKIFKNSRITQRHPIGLAHVIENADRNLLKDFYDSWYRPDNISLILVGDFDPDLARELIQKKFSDLVPRVDKRPIPEFGSINYSGIEPVYHYEKETGFTTVTLETIDIKKIEKDSFSIQKNNLVKNTAYRILQNRLDYLLSFPDVFFTSAYTASGRYLKEAVVSRMSARCEPDNWDNTLNVLEKNLRVVLEFGFYEAELDRVKKDYISVFTEAVKAQSTRENSNIARGVKYSISNDQVYTSPSFDYDAFIPVLQNMTIDDVNKAFKESWLENHRVVTVTGNVDLATQSEVPEDVVVDEYSKSSNEAVKIPEKKEVRIFPYLEKPEVRGKIESKSHIKKLDLDTIILENGVKVNLKKTNFKKNEIMFTLVFGQGKSSEPVDKPGLSYLASEVIRESGFGQIDREGLKLALSGKFSDIELNIYHDSFMISGESIASESELVFQLIYSYLMDFTVRENARKVVLNRILQQYHTFESTIEGAMTLEGNAFLAGGDKRFGLPEFEKLVSYTVKDIENWIRPALMNSELEFSMSGDFSMNEVKKLAAVYLGSLPVRSDIYPGSRDELPVFPEKSEIVLTVPTKINKGMVIVSYPTDDFKDIKQTRRFTVLSNVISDRIRETIREKMGATYSSYVSNIASIAYDGYGMLRVILIIDPKNDQLIIDEIKKIIGDISSKGISEDELRRALDPKLTELKDNRAKNSYWLYSVMASSSRMPERFDWAESIVDDFKSITKEEISDLAVKYLDNEKAVVIIVKPEMIEFDN